LEFDNLVVELDSETFVVDALVALENYFGWAAVEGVVNMFPF
jgi:hypothetical protein